MTDNEPKFTQPARHTGQQQRWSRILERAEGPTFSLLVHLLVIWLLIYKLSGTTVTSTPTYEVRVMDTHAEELQLDSTKLEPPDETIPDEAIPDDLVTQDGSVTGVGLAPKGADTGNALDVDSSTFTMIDNESPLELVGAQGAPVLLDNAASSLQLQRKAKSAFGFENNIKGDLVGTMYDLKRDDSDRPRNADYYTDLRMLVKERFSKKALKTFYRVPKQLFLSHLFLPYVKAETGPEAFGVGDLMEPTKWIIHYIGQIQAPLAGRYRFVGEFDDIVIVFVDGEVVLEAGWGDHVTEWRPKDNVGKDICYTTHALTYGDWIDLRPLNPKRIDIIIGENPGGFVGGLLMVQQEDMQYAKDSKGRPILPIFAVQPLTPVELTSLHSVPNWKFDEEHIPILGVRQERLLSKASDTNEVTITIQ